MLIEWTIVFLLLERHQLGRAWDRVLIRKFKDLPWSIYRMNQNGGFLRMNRKSVLITGVTGQDGAYLSKLLIEHDYEVNG